MNAADLPEGSVVANNKKAWIKTSPSNYSQWRGTSGGYYPDKLVQDAIDAGAKVLRVGSDG